jgi:3-hydroxyisobutyrate dehydrogenase-like beta-hydroxyacid dehydrogenase
MRANHTRSQATIGILFPGDMGSSLGRLLREDGFAVVTTVEGRSARTCRLCETAGLEVVDSFDDVVRSSAVVISVVPPAAAREVAEHYCSLVELAPSGAVFVDANPVSPAASVEMAQLFAATGVGFVDGAIHGVAAQLRTLGTLYLSGGRAEELAGRLSGSLRVKYLGSCPGQASAFKMMLGGMSKGLIALFLEMTLLAEEVGVLDKLLDCYQHFYPGVMTAVERILPTYPRHAARRVDEMRELESTMLAFGLEPCLVRGTRRLIDAVAQAGLERKCAEDARVAGIVRALHAQQVLQDLPAV